MDLREPHEHVAPVRESAQQCKRLEKMSVTSDLASGAEPRVRKPERPRGEMDASGTTHAEHFNQFEYT